MEVIHPRDLVKKDETTLSNFNQVAAIWISNHVGSMYCAYLFAIIGGTGVVAALTNSVTIVLIVGAVSGYFLQLVLLPVIMVAQNVAQVASDAKAEADHLNLLNLVQLQQEQMEILNLLKTKS